MPSRAVRSEAAIKRVIKNWSKSMFYAGYYENEPIIILISATTGELLLELDLREIIKKRKPLTGIKKQVDKIVRGGNAKQSGKKAQKGHK